MDEFKDVPIKAVIADGTMFKDIKLADSPALRRLLRNLDLGCQVLDMRKRSFFFFKRKLRPHEIMLEYAKLQMKEAIV